MNISNPFQTIRQEDRRDAGDTAMPTIDQGRATGAQKVVAGYRQDVTDQLRKLLWMMPAQHLYESLSDTQLRELSISLDLAVERIDHYLRVVQAAKEVQ